MSMFMYKIIRNYRGNFALSIFNNSILKRLLRKFCLRWQTGSVLHWCVLPMGPKEGAG